MQESLSILQALEATEQSATQITLGEGIRPEFPILDQRIGDKQLVYFDNAATSQKPQRVLDCISDYYQRSAAASLLFCGAGAVPQERKQALGQDFLLYLG